MRLLPLFLLLPCSVCLFLPSRAAQASEIDNISTHYESLSDSDAALDAIIQKGLDDALAGSKDCDLSAFGKLAAAKLVSFRFYSGAVERAAWTDPAVSRIKTSMADSVYANTPFANSIVGRMYGLDPVVSLSQIKLGTDKLGHFIDHGHNLFTKYQSNPDLQALADYSVSEEEGAFGWVTTGIKSYGDMAANMDGFSFWREVYGLGDRSFARCEQGKLVKARDFHFRDYITPAWDEAINCNQYDGNSLTLPDINAVQDALEELNFPTHSCDDYYAQLLSEQKGTFTKAVDKNIQELEQKNGKRFRCPLEPALCRRQGDTYQQRYGKAVAVRILSPDCRP